MMIIRYFRTYIPQSIPLLMTLIFGAVMSNFVQENNLLPPTIVGCPQDCSPPQGTCNFSTYNCTCNFGYSGGACQESWIQLYYSYCLGYIILFGFIGIVAGIQLARFIFLDGCKPTIPKMLHFLFLVLGIVRVAWLAIDPHDLKGRLNPVLENLLYGFGVYSIIFSYMLVVMLWASTYKKASIGHVQNRFLKHSTEIFISAIIFIGVMEVVLRTLWRVFPDGTRDYLVVIGLYYVLVLAIILMIATSFLFYGLRLYRNLIAFEDVNISIKDRLRRITVLSVGATILSVATFIWVLGSYVVEMKFYHFENMLSFLVEQFGFRGLEVCLSCLILYFLRNRSYTSPPQTTVEVNHDSSKPLLAE